MYDTLILLAEMSSHDSREELQSVVTFPAGNSRNRPLKSELNFISRQKRGVSLSFVSFKVLVYSKTDEGFVCGNLSNHVPGERSCLGYP